MTTGDLKNNLRKFHAELKRINYTNELDIEGFGVGRPSAFLPILHFVATEFSLELAQYFYSKDYELVGKNDKNFLLVLYKILRDEFNFKPPVTKEQFFTFGYAERKLQLVTSVIHLCRKMSEALTLKKKKTAQGVKSAKTSKLNIRDHIGRTVDISNVRTKQSTGSSGTCSVPSVDTVPRYTHHFSKTIVDHAFLSKQDTGKFSSDDPLPNGSPDNSRSETRILPNELSMIESENRHFAIEHGGVHRQNVADVDRNVYSSSSVLPRMSQLSPERLPVDASVSSKNKHSVKENICPNTGNYTDALTILLDQEHGAASPILLSDVFVNQQSDGAQNLATDDKVDVPLLNRSGSKSSILPQSGIEHLSSRKQINMSLPEKYSMEARWHPTSQHNSVYKRKDMESPLIGQAINIGGQGNSSQDHASKYKSISHQNKGLDKPVLSQGIDMSLDKHLPDPDPLKHVFVPHRSKDFRKPAVSGQGIDAPFALPNKYSQDRASKYAFVPCQSENKVTIPLSTNEEKFLLNMHSEDYAELLSVVRKQEERLKVLEKDHAEKSTCIDNLVETNSKLCARIMVLETTVALMQEKLDSEIEQN